MNKLPLETRVRALSMLCEGSSMRAVSRVCDVSINTVTKLLVDAGNACIAFHDEKVRNVAAKRVQCDEIWSFNYAKAKNVANAKRAPVHAGDVWTWTGIDADSKLVVSWMVGDRDAWSANVFMADLKKRLRNRVQLTTDGVKIYLLAVPGYFEDKVDYAQLVKMYGPSPEGEKRYSPAECLGAIKTAVIGEPDEKHIGTSFVERHNLTMRMHMRRFTRLTNGFSKKIDNHVFMVALYTVWYNFVKQHKTLRGITPAMAAGVTDKLWSMTEIAEMIDATLPKPGPRGPYRKAVASAQVAV